MALTNMAGGTAPLGDVDAVLAVARRDRTAADVTGGRVEHSGGFVVLVPRDAPPPRPFRLELPVPGQASLPEAGWVIEAEGPFTPDSATQLQHRPGPRDHGRTAYVSADELSGGLLVRRREPGDRIRPVGLAGRKKLQDVLVDRKVGRRDRDRVPVVTDAGGRLVWVAGVVLSEEFRVTADTKAVIILKLRRI